MSHPFIQAFVEVNIMDVKKLPATDVLHAQDLGQGPLIFVVLVPPQHGQAAALDYLPLWVIIGAISKPSALITERKQLGSARLSISHTEEKHDHDPKVLKVLIIIKYHGP